MHTCVFCKQPCEPAPTKEGWTWIDGSNGLHFHCAQIVVDNGKAITEMEQQEQSNKLPDLTIENAPTVSLIINKRCPEWGEKKFNYNSDRTTTGFVSSHGVGCNSALLFEDEYHFWSVVKFKEQ